MKRAPSLFTISFFLHDFRFLWGFVFPHVLWKYVNKQQLQFFHDHHRFYSTLLSVVLYQLQNQKWDRQWIQTSCSNPRISKQVCPFSAGNKHLWTSNTVYWFWRCYVHIHEKGETVLTPCSFTDSSCRIYRIDGWTDLPLPWSAHHIAAPPKSSGDESIWDTAGETWGLCTLWASPWGSPDMPADVQSLGQPQHVHHEAGCVTLFHWVT